MIDQQHLEVLEAAENATTRICPIDNEECHTCSQIDYNTCKRLAGEFLCPEPFNPTHGSGNAII